MSGGRSTLLTMTSTLRIADITSDNVIAACRLKVRPEQESYVAPVSVSLAQAYVNQQAAWPKLIYAGDEPVAFVMGGFDPLAEIDVFRCGIWRLNVDAAHQGKGYGRFAVHAVLDEARRRGQKRVTVLWKPGPHGPEDFYLKIGFRPTGEVLHGEKAGELFLSP
jgi:diamine N-acetyltransferase